MISVVIATYNGENYILKQLESIANQTLLPDQVIISDDGSTDSTIQIVQEYILNHSLDNWDIVKNQREKGFFNNFFNGLSVAKGDIIFLADQDDIWDRKKVESFSLFYKGNKRAIMVQSNIFFIDENDVIIPIKEKYHNKTITKDYEELTLQDMCKFAGSGYTMSFRKEVLDLIFYNNLDKKEELFKFHDLLIGILCAINGNCFLSGEVFDKHRLHSRNVTQGKGKSYLADRTRKEQLDILKRRERLFSILSNFCDSPQKAQYLNKCAEFAKNRASLIESFSIKKSKIVFKERRLYASGKGFITDIIYSLGGEKILLMLFKIFEK